MNNKPKVSVIMGVYNGERFIREAIDSVIAQTYSDGELVVVDLVHHF
jgi:glycosyltransferase involved in cell wall biosynthesis